MNIGEELCRSLRKGLKRKLGEVTTVVVEQRVDGLIRIETRSKYGPKIGPILVTPDSLLDGAMLLYAEKVIDNEDT